MSHLATTVQILETGTYVAECHTPGCDWCSDAYPTSMQADFLARVHERASQFGRVA